MDSVGCATLRKEMDLFVSWNWNYGSLTHGFMQHSGTIDDADVACTETARWYGTLIRNMRLGS